MFLGVEAKACTRAPVPWAVRLLMTLLLLAAHPKHGILAEHYWNDSAVTDAGEFGGVPSAGTTHFFAPDSQ